MSGRDVSYVKVKMLLSVSKSITSFLCCVGKINVLLFKNADLECLHRNLMFRKWPIDWLSKVRRIDLEVSNRFVFGAYGRLVSLVSWEQILIFPHSRHIQGARISKKDNDMDIKKEYADFVEVSC